MGAFQVFMFTLSRRLAPIALSARQLGVGPRGGGVRCAARLGGSRGLCAAAPPPPSDPSAPVRLYRFAHVRVLRALLRLKVLQLGVGVGVLYPAATLLARGDALTLFDGGVLAAVVGGTVVVGGTMSWYCERLVGEASWLPSERALRISTLSMWGARIDTVHGPDELARSGFFAPRPGVDAADGLHYPTPGSHPLELGEKAHIFVWGRRHVVEPTALANLLTRRRLPREP